MTFALSLTKYVGKVAIVTGASSGIGRATVEALVKHGLTVAGLARRQERVEEHAQQLKDEKGKLHAYKLDVANSNELISIFQSIGEKLGPIHVLVNNAGTGKDTTLIDGDAEAWRQILDTNLFALALASREAIKNMRSNNTSGHIVNVNSTLGHKVEYTPLLNMYAASKFGVTALTETLRMEIVKANLPIKTTSISPGWVRTEILEASFGKEYSDKVFSRNKPLNSEDIADSILYVLSTPDHVNVKELTILPQTQM